MEGAICLIIIKVRISAVTVKRAFRSPREFGRKSCDLTFKDHLELYLHTSKLLILNAKPLLRKSKNI